MIGHGESGTAQRRKRRAQMRPHFAILRKVLGVIAVCEPASMDTSHNARIRAFPKLFVHAADRARHLAIPLRSVAKRNVA